MIARMLGGGCALLLVLLVVSMGETRHWKKKTVSAEQRATNEASSHRLTKDSYRQAQADAAAAQALANKKIEEARASLSKEIADDYEKRIAAARFAAAERVRRQAPLGATAAGAPRHDPVPGSPGATVRPDGAAEEAGLSDADRLIATEQAIQLDELQRWVREVLGRPLP